MSENSQLPRSPYFWSTSAGLGRPGCPVFKGISPKESFMLGLQAGLCPNSHTSWTSLSMFILLPPCWFLWTPSLVTTHTHMLASGFASAGPPGSKKMEMWREAVKGQQHWRQAQLSRQGLSVWWFLCWVGIGWISWLQCPPLPQSRTAATLEETSGKAGRISASVGHEEVELWLPLLPVNEDSWVNNLSHIFSGCVALHRFEKLTGLKLPQKVWSGSHL